MIYEILKDGKRIALLIEDSGRIAYMYTEPEYRRRGYMKQLYNMAKKDNPDIYFDSNLTPQGKKFKDAIT